MHSLRVWDLPTRLFHWLLALLIVGLLVTGNMGGNWMVWHFRFGYAVLSLLLFRVVWGFAGGYWSRFAQFIYSPGTTWGYLRGKGTPRESTGHTPLGALSVLALLIVLFAQVSTGLMSDDEISFFGPLTRFVSGDTVSMATRYHKNVGKFVVLALVALHILALVFYRVARQQDLVGPMFTGDKSVETLLPAAVDSASTRVRALLIWLACAALVYGMVWFAERGGM